MRRLIVCLAVVGLTGCASVQSGASLIEPSLSVADAAVLANDAARWLSGPLPPAHTTLVVHSAKTEASAVITERLRAAGYGISEPSKANLEPPPDGIPVRYLVSFLSTGEVLLCLQYQGAEATRVYTRTPSGVLVGRSPFTVKAP